MPREGDTADRAYRQLAGLVHEVAGIQLGPNKRAMVEGRLGRRLQACGDTSLAPYVERLLTRRDPAELQRALDLITTNETSFFREPRHFEYLRTHLLPASRRGRPFRAWSAACSSGEEPYTLAMVLAEGLGEGAWEVLGSDLSTRVLETARSGHYPLERARGIPEHDLRRYCLRGVNKQEGTFLIDQRLRARVRFEHFNLTEPLPGVGPFDVIFLRNVMIYFDLEVKRRVVANLLPHLRPGGHFFVGHSETLHGVTEALTAVAPSVYRKPEA